MRLSATLKLSKMRLDSVGMEKLNLKIEKQMADITPKNSNESIQLSETQIKKYQTPKLTIIDLGLETLGGSIALPNESMSGSVTS